MSCLNKHKHHFIFIICLFLISVTSTFAQSNGKLKGTIITSDKDPAAGVNVILKNTKYRAITNDDGFFEFNKVKTNTYTIQISLTGYETLEQEVTVTENNRTTINLELKVSNKELKEVTIHSNRAKLFPKQSNYVSKMPLKNIENPQVYNVITSDLLKEQAVTNIDEALKNVPGIQKLWESTGRGGDGGSYYSLRGFQVQANIVNGMPGLTNGILDPANIERVEVIKGPSGTLFGSSLISYGGLINTITKKPYSGFGAEVSYLAGSFGLNRITADVNTVINDDVAIRVNGAYHTENSFQDAGFRTSTFFAPSLSYQVSEKLSFLVTTEFMQEEKTTPPMLLLGRGKPLQFTNIEDLNYNTKLSFYSNDLSMKSPKYNLQAQMQYKFSDQWISQSIVSRSSTKSDGYYSYIYDNENGLGEFGLNITREQSQTGTTGIQQNFIGDFKIGNIRNRIVAGLDYYARDLIFGGSGYAWVYNITPQGEKNYLNPYTQTLDAHNYPTRSSVDALLAKSGLTDYNNKQSTYSAYVSDVVNVLPNLIAMASVRVDHFVTKGDSKTNTDDYKQTALSPKFGIVYQPIIDKFSVFANYMNGFKNIAPRNSYDTNGQPAGVTVFKPEHANQFEFGFKTNLLDEKLNATISYYDINVKNLVTSNLNYSVQGGQSQSKGFEFDLNCSPLKGLSILAGYSFNKSIIKKGDTNNIWLEEGKRPMWSGPENLVNLWATYKFDYGKLRNFGLGFGGNYASENAVVNSDLIGKFLLPSYTVLNSSIFYNSTKFRLALNINNMTNKQYFNGGWSTVNPQRPRNAVASFTYKF